ncbi:class I SAM-dependent methyltransferase [Nocardioides terrisoli]|uniref:class I SAM-dependent methyltransferase n=1 Tax=Nocardioides terrisoli TaxID=3388267 RepID=UPI00287B5F1B|nr:class I SAM-dependent methyltransferase [Nocardioides marmorisolisilvae]
MDISFTQASTWEGRTFRNSRSLNVASRAASDMAFRVSRLLARRGALVTSIEPAEPLFGHSVRMEEQLQQGIELIQADLTTARLDRQFDAVVANMVLLSIDDWESAFEVCASALRPGGRLIFSIDHPIVSAAHNEWRSEGRLCISNYIQIRPVPRPVATDFHRRLSDYLNALRRHGLWFERIEEPTLPSEALADSDAPPHAALLQHLPPFVVVSAVKANQ